MTEHQPAENSPSKPPADLLENNEVLAKRYIKILETNEQAKYGKSNVAYHEYQKAKDKIENARMTVINTYYLREWDEYNWASKEEEAAWKAYQQAEKDSGGAIGYAGEGAQDWLEKNSRKRRASAINDEIEKTMQEKFPDLFNELNIKKDAWEKADNERYEFIKDTDFQNTYVESLKAFEQSRGKKYETNVNAFLDTVRAYQQKKSERLQTKLSDGLRNIGKPEAMTEGQNRLKKFTDKMNGIASRARRQIIKQAVWAVSAISLCFAMNKIGEANIQKAIAGDLDKMYEYYAKAPHDSLINVIFHSIAGDDTMPRQWREFLSREDSAEFINESDRMSYLNNIDAADKPVVWHGPTNQQKLDYIALWKMNEAHGNPKAIYGQHEGDHDRASYYNAENTMRLPTHAGSFILDDYIAELSHSEQWRSNKKKYDEWHQKDYKNTDSTARSMNISYHDAQLGMYKDPNTLEHEAHSVIEPKLQKEIELKKQEIIDEILKYKREHPKE